MLENVVFEKSVEVKNISLIESLHNPLLCYLYRVFIGPVKMI